MSNQAHTEFVEKFPDHMAKKKNYFCVGDNIYAVNNDGSSVKRLPVALQRAGINNATHNLKAMTLAQRLKKKLEARKAK